LELPKFTPSSDNIGVLQAEEKWLYLLRHAESMDSDQLAALLVDPPYQEAIGVLDMISKNPEDRQFYDARLKFLRDQQSQLEAAKQEGIDKGLEEGLERGEMRGKITTLQEILGDPVTSKEELDSRPLSELDSLVTHLQSRLRNRNA
jgi:flagellar biosynthesis/type III secretory pathway protein FliH